MPASLLLSSLSSLSLVCAVQLPLVVGMAHMHCRALKSRYMDLGTPPTLRASLLESALSATQPEQTSQRHDDNRTMYEPHVGFLAFTSFHMPRSLLANRRRANLRAFHFGPRTSLAFTCTLLRLLCVTMLVAWTSPATGYPRFKLVVRGVCLSACRVTSAVFGLQRCELHTVVV